MLYIAHADDQEIIRNAVASYFKAQEDVTLILQASCGEELLVGLNGVDVNAVVIDWNTPRVVGCLWKIWGPFGRYWKAGILMNIP